MDKLKIKEQKKKWYIDNREIIKQKHNMYNKSHKEQKKEWYDKTKVRIICDKCLSYIYNKGLKKHYMTMKCSLIYDMLNNIKRDVMRYKIFNYIKQYYKKILTCLIIKKL